MRTINYPPVCFIFLVMDLYIDMSVKPYSEWHAVKTNRGTAIQNTLLKNSRSQARKGVLQNKGIKNPPNRGSRSRRR